METRVTKKKNKIFFPKEKKENQKGKDKVNKLPFESCLSNGTISLNLFGPKKVKFSNEPNE